MALLMPDENYMTHGNLKMRLTHISRDGSESTSAGIDYTLELPLEEGDE